MTDLFDRAPRGRLRAITGGEAARRLGVVTRIVEAVHARIDDLDLAEELLSEVTLLPVTPSSSTRYLGQCLHRAGKPVAIRLVPHQERDTLIETFLHEIAHALDLLTTDPTERRRPHGPEWRAWAVALDIPPTRCGRSTRFSEFRRSREKLVAVCVRCGFELWRVRRLDATRRYHHRGCGGELREPGDIGPTFQLRLF